MSDFTLTTSDGYPLAVSLFKPEVENTNGKLLLINSATGVKQYVYYNFAKYLMAKGYTVITYDYRGISSSKPAKMKGFKASMRLWGTEDYKTLTNYIKTHFPHYEKYIMGHSVGALIAGMNPDTNLFKKIIFIGAQNAYVKHLDSKTRWASYLGFGILQPLLTEMLGYFPASILGLGESLPKGVAYDWRRLILNKKSTLKLLEMSYDYTEHLHQDTLVLYADDDNWLTERGVKSLMDTYHNLKPEYRIIKSELSPKKDIGHINFFRSYNAPLWHIVEDYLK
ncbi:alpha/beta hydrolase [Riemerella anatipestifer]|uniref:alpha/beta hydrolase family protein n=1 Tax=Riemerella anatipestifer TaxID=34085 RepID=UPI000D143A9D|nr:alpha/beta fold hydrolase [Riemerella anatipestifer]MBT0549225.1 alpha/beta fold hydrolase [Riemerella anatipestifer]MBT0555786.1 alpha/beta fold hydrolase [Riemerella anatipestifer]MBT0559988.1 alpha/beta fold hydrolase [Riemerella anatipestifer]MDD1525251.1 alpha/beta fold hydrolase [Riemerella anatipestifer]MDY3525329.1 alpha/beta fold hydrolase [Riemerella anatipestifer]